MHHCKCQPKMFIKKTAQFPLLLILLRGIKQCIWATVNFLDISTTLQLVIMHDLCERYIQSYKFDVPVLICVKKTSSLFPI